LFASFFHAAQPIAAVRLTMTCAGALYLASFSVVALSREERSFHRVVRRASLPAE
jgi:hypothetical protein